MTNGRRPGSRLITSIHLREYARAGKTPMERITAFLRDTDGATRADISGATGASWASIHQVLATLLADGLLSIETTVKPERYRLKVQSEGEAKTWNSQ
jgi:DNA-binding IclR family transcriptional regulator